MPFAALLVDVVLLSLSGLEGLCASSLPEAKEGSDANGLQADALSSGSVSPAVNGKGHRVME